MPINFDALPESNGGMIHGQGEKIATEHGAVREANTGRGRFDLLPYEALEAYAIWSELGAEKYGDRNWENGLSVKDCINRLIRHAIKAGNGWTDEDHLAACMWNAAAAITMLQRRPDCNDHPWTNHQPSNVYYIKTILSGPEPRKPGQGLKDTEEYPLDSKGRDITNACYMKEEREHDFRKANPRLLDEYMKEPHPIRKRDVVLSEDDQFFLSQCIQLQSMDAEETMAWFRRRRNGWTDKE